MAPVADRENIVRAICSDKYDGVRLSPSLFKGKGTSVSLLSVTPLEAHWELFKRSVQRPPERLLKFIGEINVGRLKEIGESYTYPKSLTVEPKPTPQNPAHAEIPQDISRGLAGVIVEALHKHHPPADWSA